MHKKAAASDFESLKQQLVEIGAKIKVKWSLDEVGESGWKPGWYIAYVQGYDAESDIVTLQLPIRARMHIPSGIDATAHCRQSSAGSGSNLITTHLNN